MATETIFIFLLVSGLLAAGVLTFLCIRYYFQMRHARRRLLLTEKRLGEYRRRLLVMRGRLTGGGGPSRATVSKMGLPEIDAEVGEPASSELRLRLQQGPQRSLGTVERYRLVASMARRGLSAEDISAILQLPPSETEQLLKLAQVGRAGE